MNTLEERTALANKELKELANWYVTESEKIFDELSRNPEMKIDGNRAAYEGIHKEFDERFKDLYEKYNLPLDTKLTIG